MCEKQSATSDCAGKCYATIYSMNKNIFIALGLVVLVAVGGYYFLQQDRPVMLPPVPDGPDAKEYSSTEYGISFPYPIGYTLMEYDEGNAERMMHSIVMVDEAYVNSPGTEGPPALTMTIFENPEDQSIEDWIKGNSYSNYKLSRDETLEPGMVDGKPALFYTYDGLYASAAVVTAHNGRIYMFTVGWLDTEDRIRIDFSSILDRVTFL